MNAIDKVITFIESALIHANTDQYSVGEDKEGRAVLLDNINRIRVIVGVTNIQVTKYTEADGKILHRVDIPWDYLSTRQKQKIIDLMETVDETDPEIEETLTQIFYKFK